MASATRKSSDKEEDLFPKRREPLDPPQLEQFVREYRTHFDGFRAALKAGYPAPGDVWRELLDRKDVQARLRYFYAGLDGPDRSKDALIEKLFARIEVDLSPLIKIDPVSGALRYDLRKVTPAQWGGLEISETQRTRGQKTERTIQIKPRSTDAELKALLNYFGINDPEAYKPIDRLAEAVIAIGKRGSAAPVATYHDDDDED